MFFPFLLAITGTLGKTRFLENGRLSLVSSDLLICSLKVFELSQKQRLLAKLLYIVSSRSR